MRRSMELEAQREVLAPGSTDPFEHQFSWLQLNRDTIALRALVTRAQRVKAFDTAAATEQQASYLAGKQLTMVLEATTARREKWSWRRRTRTLPRPMRR